jgi:Uma2 family endonuclease
MSSLPNRKYTVDEYFELERTSDVRHEYYNGEIFAMAGASLDHIRISKTISRLVDDQGFEQNCESFLSDARVRVDDLHYVYPDVVVVCGEPDIGYEETVLNPSVIFEVLSESTKGYDYNLKFQRYQRIKTLTDYLLVAQDRVLVIHHKRDGKTWKKYKTTVHSEKDEHVDIESIGCTLLVADIYTRVNFDASPTDDEGV